jgi:hypothetical protein
MKKILICLMGLIYSNAKAIDDHENVIDRIQKESAQCIANIKRLRNNADHGLQLIEPAFDACHSMLGNLLDLRSFCFTGIIKEKNSCELSPLLHTKNYMQQLEEGFKLIPSIQTIVIGPLNEDRVEIGVTSMGFDYLELDSLNSSINQNIGTSKENLFGPIIFYDSVNKAYKKLSEITCNLWDQIRKLAQKRTELDRQISEFIDARNIILRETEKNSPSLNALSLARLQYKKKEVRCTSLSETLDANIIRIILEEFIS